MKVAIFVNTPAQIHFFKNIARELEAHGNPVSFLLRDYRETVKVADELGLRYYIYAKGQTVKVGSLFSFPKRLGKAIVHLRDFQPDVVVGFGVYDAYSASVLGKPCIEFEDSEPRVSRIYSLELKMYLPFVDAVITPESFLDNLGERQIRVRSYKELAYLHPNYFDARSDILDELGVGPDEDYSILRFNAFDAVHDAGVSGFQLEQEMRLVSELEKHSRVYISSEGKVAKNLEKYRLNTPTHRIHEVLHYAKLLVCDGQTMATEAGILGTPAIRCNTFVGSRDMSNFVELEERYGLIFNYQDPEQAISKAVELIQQPGLRREWAAKRDRLLNEKIDMTKFMVWFIEEYPESISAMRGDPSVQMRFK